MNTASLPFIELARQVRGCTLRLIEQVPAPWQRWAPPGTSNHVLWHAGHVLWVADVLIVEPLTGNSELPPGWAETFGQDCRPVRETTSWPDLAEVRQRLADQLPRLIALLEGAPADRLQAIDAPADGWNLPRGILHGLHDEARHHGEMYLLLKQCAAHANR